MKVLDLQCPHGHSFEGWFGSEDDFQSQLARELVECPVCGDTAVAKKLSAPRLNLGASEPAESPRREVAAVEPQLQAAWMKMVRHVLANTEDVGGKFAEEARRIHYGETAERSIRGQASREETESLLEEGIAVMPLPIPKALKEPLQ
ncbi:DUF1178 family protein [Pseudorhodoferax soli]|jgi:hypothetical protein|uniref:DUF1178 family protein n=1 Tax=Pseudorhodoferax soli TaxID=545864 RepID=A0A368Y5T8_9BURK|nr:DUF1178 family protein [Pseudorhodoferax soli]RCW75631.1 hypothetical protein DES41_101225 [Pseudorhodoferax soli]